jgi:hypothetical protein
VYEAQHASRYERQRLICDYQQEYECRFVVMIGNIMPYTVTYLEDTLYDADSTQDLHIMLDTQGGDAETALRLIRQAQARCKELTVIVPNQAKSAGTLFALGADHIYMGPPSDLGPIDPQIVDLVKNDLYPAKAIIAAVEGADRRIQEYPQTYPLHAALLSDITALMVQRARDEIERTDDQLKEALSCASGRDKQTVEDLASKLRGPLIKDPQSHRMAVSARFAISLGLPVRELRYDEQQWKDIWRLWAKYAILNIELAYEGQSASQILYRKV